MHFFAGRVPGSAPAALDADDVLFLSFVMLEINRPCLTLPLLPKLGPGGPRGRSPARADQLRHSVGEDTMTQSKASKRKEKESPAGRWISYRPEIKVLDCTIRDGGLMNNHQFDDR